MPSSPIHVSLLALPQTEPSVLFGTYDLLWAAGVAHPVLTGDGRPRHLFRPEIIGLERTPFPGVTGAIITPERALAEVGTTDILVVPTLFVESAVRLAEIDPRAVAWTRALHDAGTEVYAACGGALVAAEAGLLDGGAATIHWTFAHLFRAMYPKVALYPERALVQSGPSQRVVTAGGGAAWQDMVLFLVARYAGDAEARRLARLFHLQLHNEGLSPFAGLIQTCQHDDAIVRDAQVWAAAHYDRSDATQRLAIRAGLPERTFVRRFRKATGYSPKVYVQTLRIEEAKQILETTAAPVEEVAEAVGYRDPASFRHIFKRQVGLSPATYRRRFRLPRAVVAGGGRASLRQHAQIDPEFVDGRNAVRP